MGFERLAVLVSGRGRNLQAILDAVAAGHIPAAIACVVSNRADAQGLARARDAGIPARVVPHVEFENRVDFDRALDAALREAGADFIALAGFMRVLGEDFVGDWSHRLVNVHPSLLPRHRGLHTHRRVLEAGDAEHGASVHYVTAELDGGPVAVQGRFRVHPQDDEESLQARVMEEIELKIYPQALAWMASGRLQLTAQGVQFDGQPLRQPLGLEDLEPPFR